MNMNDKAFKETNHFKHHHHPPRWMLMWWVKIMGKTHEHEWQRFQRSQSWKEIKIHHPPQKECEHEMKNVQDMNMIHKDFKANCKENYGEIRMHFHLPKKNVNVVRIGKEYTWICIKVSNLIIKRIMGKSKCIVIL